MLPFGEVPDTLRYIPISAKSPGGGSKRPISALYPHVAVTTMMAGMKNETSAQATGQIGDNKYGDGRLILAWAQNELRLRDPMCGQGEEEQRLARQRKARRLRFQEHLVRLLETNIENREGAAAAPATALEGKRP